MGGGFGGGFGGGMGGGMNRQGEFGDYEDEDDAAKDNTFFDKEVPDEENRSYLGLL